MKPFMRCISTHKWIWSRLCGRRVMRRHTASWRRRSNLYDCFTNFSSNIHDYILCFGCEFNVFTSRCCNYAWPVIVMVLLKRTCLAPVNRSTKAQDNTLNASGRDRNKGIEEQLRPRFYRKSQYWLIASCQ